MLTIRKKLEPRPVCQLDCRQLVDPCKIRGPADDQAKARALRAARRFGQSLVIATSPQFKSIRDFLIAAIVDAIQQQRTLPSSKPPAIPGDSLLR